MTMMVQEFVKILL